MLTSAKSYIPEMVWNDTTFSIENGGGFASGGGGVSAVVDQAHLADWRARHSGRWPSRCAGYLAGCFPVPRRPSLLHPGVDRLEARLPTSPAARRPASAYRIQARQDNGNFVSVAGGTSFAAPEFAGLLAIIEQKMATGGGLGNINPAFTNWPRMRPPMLRPFTTSRPGTTRCPAPPVPPIAPQAPTP